MAGLRFLKVEMVEVSREKIGITIKDKGLLRHVSQVLYILA